VREKFPAKVAEGNVAAAAEAYAFARQAQEAVHA
jgi:Pyruvate/2-oxoacid:ferredoxin oxidoreductase gamma subunit